MVARLLPSQPDRDSASPPSSVVTDQGSNVPASDIPSTTSDSPWVLPTMSRDDVLWLIHHKGTVLPPVCPCDTANSSEKKTHWSAKELHRAMGCRKFKNYKHLLLVSRDSQWIDSGKFPPSLGSFATVPKGKKGKPIDRTLHLYLDIVHVDIAFGDCVLVGGFQCTLILVDRATRCNWTFGLKDLSSVSILGAFAFFMLLRVCLLDVSAVIVT
jgi:hypothetical protein